MAECGCRIVSREAAEEKHWKIDVLCQKSYHGIIWCPRHAETHVRELEEKCEGWKRAVDFYYESLSALTEAGPEGGG